MGMYDNVKYEAPCPKCGEKITAWQSKAGPCSLATLEPWEVANFYAPCLKCHAWIDAKVKAEIEHVVKRCDVTLSVDEDFYLRKQNDQRT